MWWYWFMDDDNLVVEMFNCDYMIVMLVFVVNDIILMFYFDIVVNNCLDFVVINVELCCDVDMSGIVGNFVVVNVNLCNLEMMIEMYF